MAWTALAYALLLLLHSLSIDAELSNRTSRYRRVTSAHDNNVDPSDLSCQRVAQSVLRDEAYTVTISAQDAEDCLWTVPLNPDDARSTIQSILNLFEFHSLIPFLDEFVGQLDRQTFDIYQSLRSIWERITDGSLKSEFAFESSIYDTIQQARDNHFIWKGTLIDELFRFQRSDDVQLVSLSVNGAVPQVYLFADVVDNVWDPVQTIDGVPVQAALEAEAAKRSGCLDADAAWNTMFATSHRSLFNNPSASPGATVTIGFQNKPALQIPNTAIATKAGWTTIHDGQSLYNALVKSSPDDPDGMVLDKRRLRLRRWRDLRRKRERPFVDKMRARGRPKKRDAISVQTLIPDVSQEQEPTELAGFFLSRRPEQAPIAALKLGMFGPLNVEDDQEQKDFLRDTVDFLDNFFRECQKRKVASLVVDLRDNPGGSVEEAIGIFKRFFPDVRPFTGHRFRLTYLLRELGKVAEQVPQFTGPLEMLWNPFEPEYHSCSTWASVTSNPVIQFSKEAFTRNLQWSYVSADWRFPDGMEEVGSPFMPDDIVLLTDGYCHGACALFLSMMTTEVRGVRVVTVGGRPRTGPMEALGCSKGAVAMDAEDIEELGDRAREKLADNLASPLLHRLPFHPPIRYAESSVNLIDTIRRREPWTPLEYLAAPSDCRLWYTPDDAFDSAALWTRVYNIAFEGPTNGWDYQKCVPSSYGV